MKNIDEIIQFTTDTATLALFDPATLSHHLTSEADWWTDNFHMLEEVANGTITLISLSNDGHYKIRITSDGLTNDEKDFAREVIGPLGLISQSGEIFIGAAECMPASEFMPSPQNINNLEGKFISLPPGLYSVTAYYIDANGCHGVSSLSKTLPDIVLIIQQRAANWQFTLSTEPRFNTTVKTFLFPSERNAKKQKPKLGLIIKAKVWSTTRTTSGLAIKKDCILPESYIGYELILEDMSQVKAGDRIKIKTTRIDEENKLIFATLLEITSKN